MSCLFGTDIVSSALASAPTNVLGHGALSATTNQGRFNYEATKDIQAAEDEGQN